MGIKISQERLLPYLFIAPTLIVVFAFILYPLGEMFRLSFTDTVLLSRSAPRFVGLNTYLKLFSDPLLALVIRNTLLWVFLGCLLSMLIGGACGYFMSFAFPVNRVVRSAILVPWILPLVVAAGAWKWMYNSDFGVINDVLERLRLIHHGIPFLGSPELVVPSLIVIMTWHNVPFIALMVSASVQAVPTSLLEAATIDGANGWNKLRLITLPLISYTVTVLTIITMINTANDLIVVWTTTRGGPSNASQILSTYIYQMAFESYQWGTAAALSVLNFGLLLVLTVGYLMLFRQSWSDA